MKRIMTAAVLAALAGAALPAQGDSCVTNPVPSANLFGAVSVTSGQALTYVAVPFGAFGAGDAPIAAADLVEAASLADGDKMYVWNPDEGEGQYDVYVVAGGAWTAANKVTVTATGTSNTENASPDTRTVAAGTGVFIERGDTTKPIYVYGQVRQASGATTLPAGLTLVSAPSTHAMAAADLNEATWTGVAAAKGSNGFVGDTTGADMIMFRTAAGKVARCYYVQSGGGYRWVATSGKSTTVPAGSAFWYQRAGEGSATMTW